MTVLWRAEVMRAVFVCTLLFIAAGLAYMITIGLLQR